VSAADEDGWTPVGALADLPEGRGTAVEIGADRAMVVRSGERVFAVADRCTHQGASLSRGPVRITDSLATVTCPVHGSRFRLDDGRVLRGPAARPLDTYEVRVEDGVVELRPRA
jgi:nitrite reductase/ring-hydroxylating ferredoxin subunit